MKRVQLGWLAGLLVAFAGAAAQANPIVPANDGVGSVVNRVGNQFDITGGTRAGSNLFHSLLKFGLSEQQIANFLSQPTIRNILTRVTGGETSVINGLIKVTGGPSNLYLLNPAGLVFGPNAQLDIPGSFYGTTANAIKVGNGWFGLHTSPSELQRLTGEPSGFAFSSGNQVLNGEIAGIIKNEGKLSVPGGERVVLAGGIVVNTGTIETPHGQIVVTASPGGRYVEITPAGSALSFRLPVAEDQALAADNLRPLRLEDIARLATGTVEVGGTLTTASNVVNPNSRIELVGESVQLVRGITISTAGTTGLIQVQVNPLVPVEGWVFVDRERNFEDIVNALAAGYRLVLLNPSDSGVAVVNQALAGQSGLKSLHIVSGGNQGQFWLGRDFVSVFTWERYAEQVAKWGQYLDKDGGIFLYACDLAASAFGKGFADTIAQATGRAVSASTDPTGHVKYGGNWLLEYGPGGPLPFVVSQIADADVKLQILPVARNDDGVGAYNSAAPNTWKLRAAINAANPGDTVRLINGNNLQNPPGSPTTNKLSSGDTINLTAGAITFTKDGVTLDIDDVAPPTTPATQTLSNITIKAQASNRVFVIDAANITIDGKQGGITLLGNGAVVGDGGVIQINAEKSLKLTGSVTVKGGNATNGGGISLANGTAATKTALVLTGQAQVFNNAAANQGGGIYTAGGKTTVTISGSAKVQGNVANEGGGIYAQGELKLLDNAEIVANNANAGEGGGVYWNGSTFTFASTARIKDNQANTDGGGIYAAQALTLAGGQIINNKANDEGGGIYVAPGKNLTLQSDVKLTGNKANNDGGGIYFAGGAGNILKLQGTASVGDVGQGNKANKGGGIFVAAGDLVIQDQARVSGNLATIGANNQGGGVYWDSTGTFTLASTAQISNNEAGDGGGIYAAKDLLLIAGKVIENVANGKGGGIFVPANKNLKLQGSAQVLKNKATNEGGGIYFDGTGGTTLTLQDSVLVGDVGQGNKADRGGGIFVGNTGNLTIQGNAKVRGNDVTDVGNVNRQGGGVFWNSTGAFTLASTAQISNNTAKEGGGVYISTPVGGDLLADGQILANQATDKGGGIFVAANITLQLGGGIRIQGNQAGTDGGGIYFTGGAGKTLTLKDSAQVGGPNLTDANKADRGGGIFVANGNLAINDLAQVTGNLATIGANNQGGGVYWDSAGTFTVAATAQISGNKAQEGGGIYANKDLVLAGGKVLNNQAGSKGGGIFVAFNKNLTLQVDTKVEGNIADTTTGKGGGIYFTGGPIVNLKLQGLTRLVNNQASKGGAIYMEGGTLTMQNTAKIIDNQSVTFGGGGIYAKDSTLFIEDDALVQNNQAAGWGGGIRLENSQLTLKGNVQINNNQAFKGGGIYAGDGSTITAQQNLGGFSPKILNNQSVLGGGGIFAKDSTLTLKDSTLISGNTAGGWGGGIRLLDSTAILKDNVKILSNTAKFGGGIYVGGISTLTFTDSTVQVQGNTATQPTPSGGGIFIFKLGSTPSTVPPATLPPNVAIPGPATQVTGNSPDNIVVGPLGP